MKKTVLITGSNGLLGQKLVQLFAADREVKVIATSLHYDKINGKGYRFESIDITDDTSLVYTIQKYQPDVIINAAGITNVDQCETERELAWRVNVEAVENLAKISAANNIHLIHLSTDFVFDGINPPYSETDQPNPVSYYGLTKWKGEQRVQNHANKWTIVRTILLYGVLPAMSRSNIVLWVKKSLEKQQEINVVTDQFRMPTLVEDLAKACKIMVEKKAEGIFHISGKEYISVFDIAIQVAKFFKLDTSLIQPVSSLSLNQIGKRPPKTAFVLDKALRELDYYPQSFTTGLETVAGQLNLPNS